MVCQTSSTSSQAAENFHSPTSTANVLAHRHAWVVRSTIRLPQQENSILRMRCLHMSIGIYCKILGCLCSSSASRDIPKLPRNRYIVRKCLQGCQVKNAGEMLGSPLQESWHLLNNDILLWSQQPSLRHPRRNFQQTNYQRSLEVRLVAVRKSGSRVYIWFSSKIQNMCHIYLNLDKYVWQTLVLVHWNVVWRVWLKDHDPWFWWYILWTFSQNFFS